MATPLTGPQIIYTVAGMALVFLLWEYAPPLWGGLFLIAVTLVLAGKALSQNG
jgi:hypothetical protein